MGEIPNDSAETYSLSIEAGGLASKTKHSATAIRKA
jgi:hypothetical protein